MFNRNSLFTRIAIGKGVGFLFGLAGFITLPYFLPEPNWMLRWGILFWYPTVGAVIGVFGVYTWHPVLHLPLPWWFRAPLIGAWMNFVLAFFAYEQLERMLIHMFGVNGLLQSPFWVVPEGVIVGLIIGGLATKFAGEGPKIADR